MFSYAQNLEDVRVAHLFPGKTDGVYVDVGGGHPIADNATFMLYLMGWSGLVVEPQAGLAALYPKLRPRDRIETTLVGAAAGTVDFHVVDRLHGLSSILPAQAEAAREWGAGHRVERRAIEPLRDLVARHGIGRVDLLKIDVEGAERDVLEGFDFRAVKPTVMVIEAIYPGHTEPDYGRFEPFVTDLGYVRAHYDGLNVTYVDADRPEIAARFTAAMEAEARTSDALHAYGRAAEDGRHPDHAIARALARGLLARLPFMPPEEVAALMPDGAPAPGTDAFRALIGRIASGTDGGKIHWD